MSTKATIKIFIIGISILSLSVSASTLSAQTMSISQLQQEIDQLTQQIAQLKAQQGTTTTTSTTTVSIPKTFTFTTNLKLGTSSQSVKYLQIALNSDPATQVSTTGNGSPGKETMYFGSKTQQAVIKFQQKYKSDISQAAGYAIQATGNVGPGTRTKLNQLLTQTTRFRSGCGSSNSPDKSVTACGRIPPP